MQIFLFIFFFLTLIPSLAAAPEDPFSSNRQRMVKEQIEERGVKDQRVLEVMRKVKRHLFVPAPLQISAYDDRPLPIGRARLSPSLILSPT